jgi:hypothetical protein
VIYLPGRWLKLGGQSIIAHRLDWAEWMLSQITYSWQSELYMIRFLVVKLTHPDLNFIFDMSVVFMVNYFFSGRRHPH